MDPTITIDMDIRCMGCGQMGAMPNGFCLKCWALRVPNRKGPQERPERPRAARGEKAGGKGQGALFGGKA